MKIIFVQELCWYSFWNILNKLEIALADKNVLFVSVNIYFLLATLSDVVLNRHHYLHF